MSPTTKLRLGKIPSRGINWGATKGNSLRPLCATSSTIWSARNEAVWNHKVPIVKLVVHNVIDVPKTKFKFLESLRADIA